MSLKAIIVDAEEVRESLLLTEEPSQFTSPDLGPRC